MTRWFRSAPEEAVKPPVSRRLKTYSADTGYVYQYRSTGSRGDLYFFELSYDMATWSAFSVELPVGSATALTGSERFGVAKVIFMRHLDNAQPSLLGSHLRASDEDIRKAAGDLGIF